jgi:hypothetical protein
MDNDYLVFSANHPASSMGAQLYLNQSGKAILRAQNDENATVEALNNGSVKVYSSGTGDITLSALGTGPVNISTISGDITLDSNNGQLNITSSGGDIVVSAGGGDFRQDAYKVKLEGLQSWVDYDFPDRQIDSQSGKSYVYQNLTTRDIAVSVGVSYQSISASGAQAYISSVGSPYNWLTVSAWTGTSGTNSHLYFVVPVGHYYACSYTGTGTVPTGSHSWKELRV